MRKLFLSLAFVCVAALCLRASSADVVVSVTLTEEQAAAVQYAIDNQTGLPGRVATVQGFVQSVVNQSLSSTVEVHKRGRKEDGERRLKELSAERCAGINAETRALIFDLTGLVVCQAHPVRAPRGL